MRRARKRIQEQIGEALPGQMLCDIHPRGEDQAPRVNAPRLCFPLQIGSGRFIVLEQPQHTAIICAQQPRPDVENRRRDLVAVVEGCEHETGVRQSGFGAGRRVLRHLARGIIGLIGIGQVDDLLAIGRSVLGRNHDSVGKNVIHVVGPHRAGMGQIIHLHGRRPMSKNARPAVLRKTFQIDGNIDLQLPDHRGKFCIALGPHIDEAIASAPQPGAHLASVIGPE